MDTPKTLSAACRDLADRINSHKWHPDHTLTYFADNRDSGELSVAAKLAADVLRELAHHYAPAAALDPNSAEAAQEACDRG